MDVFARIIGVVLVVLDIESVVHGRIGRRELCLCGVPLFQKHLVRIALQGLLGTDRGEHFLELTHA